MKASDFPILIKHYLGLVVLVPLVSALLVGVFAAVSNHADQTTYSSTTKLIVADPSGLLSAAGVSALQVASSEQVVGRMTCGDISLTATTYDSSRTTEFVAEGFRENEVLSSSEEAAKLTAEAVRQALAEQAESIRSSLLSAEQAIDSNAQDDLSGTLAKVSALESCVFSIVPEDVISVGPVGILKYASIGLLGGLLVVLFALVTHEMIRRPIKSRYDVADITDLPVLNGNGGEIGADITRVSLLAICGAMPDVVAVVPVGGSSEPFSDQLASSIACSSSNTSDVRALDYIDESAESCSIASTAGATIVCVHLWKSSANDLRLCLNELSNLKARVVGISLVN